MIISIILFLDNHDDYFNFGKTCKDIYSREYRKLRLRYIRYYGTFDTKENDFVDRIILGYSPRECVMYFPFRRIINPWKELDNRYVKYIEHLIQDKDFSDERIIEECKNIYKGEIKDMEAIRKYILHHPLLPFSKNRPIDISYYVMFFMFCLYIMYLYFISR
jgi:hypothetical protein